MSDDDRDIEVDSDEDGMRMDASASDRRAHHNALERKRRDHIKDSFSKLRDAIPSSKDNKLSRAQILKKASEYIIHMRKENLANQQDVDTLKRQNALLENQIRVLERAKSQGTFCSVQEILSQHGLLSEPQFISTSTANSDCSSSFDIESDTSINGGGSGPRPPQTVQTISPGQSLLIAASGAPGNGSSEPAKKKFRLMNKQTLY